MSSGAYSSGQSASRSTLHRPCLLQEVGTLIERQSTRRDLHTGCANVLSTAVLIKIIFVLSVVSTAELEGERVGLGLEGPDDFGEDVGITVV